MIVFVHRGVGMASYRYRCEIPCRELNKLGIKASINQGEGKIVVFSKPVPDDVDVAKKAKSEGACIVTDIGDDHFYRPEYWKLLALADYTVCPTETMAKIQQEMGASPVIIPDPYEVNEQPPHVYGMKLLWHGHNSNLSDLDFWRPHLKERDLTIVTGPKPVENTLLWSPETIQKELNKSDIVIIPTRKEAAYKSPNRLINSLRAGCFPVCGFLPSHDEFRPFCWIGDVHTGLRWAEHFNTDLNNLVKQGQDYIRDKFSPATIGEQWKNFFVSI